MDYVRRPPAAAFFFASISAVLAVLKKVKKLTILRGTNGWRRPWWYYMADENGQVTKRPKENRRVRTRTFGFGFPLCLRFLAFSSNLCEPTKIWFGLIGLPLNVELPVSIFGFLLLLLLSVHTAKNITVDLKKRAWGCEAYRSLLLSSLSLPKSDIFIFFSTWFGLIKSSSSSSSPDPATFCFGPCFFFKSRRSARVSSGWFEPPAGVASSSDSSEDSSSSSSEESSSESSSSPSFLRGALNGWKAYD